MKLLAKIQRLPPKVPVYSYHCINEISFANTFPKFNQGHENSQPKCNFSKLSHSTTKNEEAAVKATRFATI